MEALPVGFPPKTTVYNHLKKWCQEDRFRALFSRVIRQRVKQGKIDLRLAGNRLTKTLENGVLTSYVSDPANRLLTLNNQEGSSLLASYTYTYNTVNVRLTRTETVNGTGTTQNYGYNPIDQVTSVNYRIGRNQGFAYDFVGNRQQVTDTAATVTPATYSTNNLNQYTAVTSQPSTLSYDKNGNLLNASGFSYGYDSQNRLISGNEAGNSEVLAYDPRNRCVSRTLTGSSTFFIFDGWSSLAEYNPSGGLQTKYINGTQIDEKLAVLNTGSTPLYFLQDGLGTNTALTDLNGNVLERYLYDVYGKVSITNGLGQSQSASNYGNRYLFTGREFLFKLNVCDYRNRFYSADLGRWMQRDPLKNAERIQGPNLYDYCENAPDFRVNSMGMNWLDAILFFLGHLVPGGEFPEAAHSSPCLTALAVLTKANTALQKCLQDAPITCSSCSDEFDAVDAAKKTVSKACDD